MEVDLGFAGAFHQAHPKGLDRPRGIAILEQLPALVEPVAESPPLVPFVRCPFAQLQRLVGFLIPGRLGILPGLVVEGQESLAADGFQETMLIAEDDASVTGEKFELVE